MAGVLTAPSTAMAKARSPLEPTNQETVFSRPPSV